MTNEKDANVIHNLFAEYHYADDLGVIKSKLAEYVATVRAEVEAEYALCRQVQKRGEHSSVTCPCVVATCAASAAPVVGHHKHCSAWTVTTSGEKKPCDCVCQCTHTMFEHIRPGEHYWYEDCAADGCSCMKFTAAATAAPVGQYYCPEHRYNPPPNSGFAFCPQCETEALDRSKAVRVAAEEWFTLRGEKYPDVQPAIDELAAIIERHCFRGAAETNHNNYQQRDDGLYVCYGNHQRSDGCEWVKAQ